jgi:hypothetical protein
MRPNSLHIPTLIKEIIEGMRYYSSITCFTAVTGGYRISTPDTKDLSNGDYVTISGTTNFDGEYCISSLVKDTSFVIEKTGTYSTETGVWTANKPYFIYGTIREVTNTLTEKDKSNTRKFQKYPLIVLLLDIDEEKGLLNVYSELECRMWICNTTNKEWTSEQRTDGNFIPILLPIYERLMTELESSQYLIVDRLRGIPHKKTDRYYWGEDDHTTHVFNDYIDGIDIQNLKLQFKKQFNSCKNGI